MRTIRFGLIGCGLMGREFASALARWRHLPDMPARPELVAVCDYFSSTAADAARWLRENLPSIQQVTTAGQSRGGSGLLRSPAPLAPGVLLRCTAGGQALDGREALWDRPAREPSHPGGAPEAPGTTGTMFLGIPLLPGGPENWRHDRARSFRANPGSQLRFSSLQRSRPP